MIVGVYMYHAWLQKRIAGSTVLLTVADDGCSAGSLSAPAHRMRWFCREATRGHWMCLQVQSIHNGIVMAH